MKVLAKVIVAVPNEKELDELDLNVPSAKCIGVGRYKSENEQLPGYNELI